MGCCGERWARIGGVTISTSRVCCSERFGTINCCVGIASPVFCGLRKELFSDLRVPLPLWLLPRDGEFISDFKHCQASSVVLCQMAALHNAALPQI